MNWPIINWELAFTTFLPMYIIPMISIYLSFWFGLKTKERDVKVEALKTRYDNLYEPLLRLTIESWKYVKIPSSFPKELREKFIDLFDKNIGEMGVQSLEFYPKMYESYLFYLQKTVGKVEIHPDLDKFDINFNIFCNLLMKECSIIREKLKYPEIPKSFSDAYSSDFLE